MPFLNRETSSWRGHHFWTNQPQVRRLTVELLGGLKKKEACGEVRQISFPWQNTDTSSISYIINVASHLNYNCICYDDVPVLLVTDDVLSFTKAWSTRLRLDGFGMVTPTPTTKQNAKECNATKCKCVNQALSQNTGSRARVTSSFLHKCWHCIGRGNRTLTMTFRCNVKT